MASDLTLRNFKLSTAAKLTPAGTVGKVTVVAYYLGGHGPFADEYPGDQVDPNLIRNGILQRRDAIDAAMAGL